MLRDTRPFSRIWRPGTWREPLTKQHIAAQPVAAVDIIEAAERPRRAGPDMALQRETGITARSV